MDRAVSVIFQVQYAGTIPLNITAVVPAVALGAICGLLSVGVCRVTIELVGGIGTPSVSRPTAPPTDVER